MPLPISDICLFSLRCGVLFSLSRSVGKHKGFGFVEFESDEDAADAMVSAVREKEETFLGV
jgi:RNA recognition motif